MTGPLDGVKILDFTEIIAGPFAAMLLADMGADVIKIEPPWGEPWRLNQPFLPFEARTYISLNRGKRSLPLDLTKPEAREVIYKLIPDTDVVIINYRPDVPYNLGIDYETLSAINPRLVYCENTAFGRRGPHGQRPGYDIIIQAMSGLMAGDGKLLDGLPQTANPAIADFSTGLALAWGVSSALYARERTGLGQKVEATLLATALAIQTGQFLQVNMIEEDARKEMLEDLALMRAEGRPYSEIYAHYDTLRRRQRLVYYRTYQTKDGVVAVGCLSDPLRKRMANVLGLHDIRFEPGYDPTSDETRTFNEKLTIEAEALFLEKSTDEWVAALDGAGVPCGPVNFTEELMHDEQVISNDLVVDLEHTTAGAIRMVGPTLRMSETPLEVKSASPGLGEHTDEILTSLGYSPEEVQRFKDDSVTR